MTNESGPRAPTELAHEPWPGFRTAFLVVFTAACLYLAALLFATIPGVTDAPPPSGAGEHAR